MNKKILVVFGSMLVLVMLAIPINGVLAPKVEKVDVEFYGFPLMGLNTVTEDRDAGKSSNHFLTWVVLDWEFGWDYEVLSPGPPPIINRIDVFAAGNYYGLWIMHGYEPGFPMGTFTRMNVHGRHAVTVSDWDGMTGEFVLQGNGAKWNVVSGTIGGMTLHGGGTIEKEPDVAVWKYSGAVYLTP